MLQRTLIHFSLILLFALTQIGFATHEISHLSDGLQPDSSQQQHDKNQNQCSQCLGYSHLAAADIGHVFNFTAPPADHIYVAVTLSSSASIQFSFYSARAPPQPSQA